MLVHICCAVDSHYFLQKLKLDFPDEKLIGFFYDPNIHPYSEYYLRLLEVKRSCKLLDIDLIEGEYNIDGWLNAVRGLESEPEKGSRCSVCFDYRFEESAKIATKLGEKSFTSTLLTSPKKSLKQLKISGDQLGEKYGIDFVAPDYRKASGTQEQNILAKESKLYRQDYCGCVYALRMQRDEQNRLSDELISPISGQVQPESIEERIELYEKRVKLEESGAKYIISKHRFMNWRLKFVQLTVKKEPQVAHVLPYSVIKKGYTRGRIEDGVNGLFFLNRDEVKFITLETYNKLAQTTYDTIVDLIFSPPLFDDEIVVRNGLLSSPYNLSAILVVERIPENKLEIRLDSMVYEDVREHMNIVG